MVTNNLPNVSIKFDVPNKVFTGLAKLAKQNGNMPNAQAKDLFLAAYSARFKPTGDEALDEAVAKLGGTPASLANDDKLREKIREMAAQIEAAAGVAKELADARAELQERTGDLAAAREEIATLKGAPKPEYGDSSIWERPDLVAEIKIKEAEIFAAKSEAAQLSRELLDAKDQIALHQNALEEAAAANKRLSDFIAAKDSLLAEGQRLLEMKDSGLGVVTDQYNASLAKIEAKDAEVGELLATNSELETRVDSLAKECAELKELRAGVLKPPAGGMAHVENSTAGPSLKIRFERLGQASSLKIDLFGEANAHTAEGIAAACEAFGGYRVDAILRYPPGWEMEPQGNGKGESHAEEV